MTTKTLEQLYLELKELNHKVREKESEIFNFKWDAKEAIQKKCLHKWYEASFADGEIYWKCSLCDKTELSNNPTVKK